MNSPIERIPENGGVPIRFFLTQDMMPDHETIRQLENLANASGVSHHVAVLPDIHRKSRNLSPTGTVVVSKKSILPRAVDTGINCGIRMIRTDIDIKDLTVEVIDNLFRKLLRSIPVSYHAEDVIGANDVLEILLSGGTWSKKKYNLEDYELNHVEEKASMPNDATSFEDILDCIPKKALKKGRRCFATIGDGNHFLELQEIVEILDRDKAKLLGLQKGKAFFMLHTGSRSVGSKTMKYYLNEWENRFQNMQSQKNGSPIWSIPANSEEGIKFARAVSSAANFGFANRIAITEELRYAMQEVLGDSSIKLPLLYDCAHVSIKQETLRGEKIWIHRHGASQALPASQWKNYPIFAKTGQPVPIPGSMGHHSFVGVAEEKALEAFCSVNHGAGRIMDKPEASRQFSKDQVEKELREKNIRLYRYHSDNIAEQAPASFKNISDVIEAMSTLALARPVVRLRPIAVLKG